MALYLVTGQPGHGKTAYALDKAFKFKNEGRTVYVHGVKDFDYEKAGMKYLDDPTKWQELPDGSVILLDECYTVFPNRNPGSRVPDHVEAMARHRHRGFDFILVAQQGLQLDPFLRGLYEEHCHVRQTSIMRSKTKLKRWNQYQSNVQAACSDTVDWVRPKYVFDYYTSTTLVTTKRRLPTWLIWLIAGIVFVVIVLVGLKWHFDSKIKEFDSERERAMRSRPALTGGDVTAGGGTTQAGASPQRSYKTPTDYALAHLPRFATMPWTAPIYDGAQPVGQPQIYCMSSQPGLDGAGQWSDGGCKCVTEQGTKYALSEPECRTVARNSAPYNPYRQPPQLNQVQAVNPVSAVASSAPASASISLADRANGTFPENAPKAMDHVTF